MYDLSEGETDTCRDDVSNCHLNNEASEYVQFFAKDENRDEFLKTFLRTYEKLRNDGYSNGKVLASGTGQWIFGEIVIFYLVLLLIK